LIWATPHQRGFTNTTSRSSAPARANVPAPTIPTSSLPTSSQRSLTPAQVSAQHAESVRKQQEAIQKAAELRQIINGLEKVDDEGRRGTLLDTLCSNEDVLNMPLYPNPPGTATGELKVDLLNHQVSTASPIYKDILPDLLNHIQLQALQWCIDRENPVLPVKESEKPVQFWQFRAAGNQVSASLHCSTFLVPIDIPTEILL